MKQTVAPQPAPVTLWRCGGRQCPPGECDHEDGELHRHASGPGPRYAPPLVHDVLRTSGSPLPAGVRTNMEHRLGHDFAHVRIHTDARAAESAQAIDAQAYTVGSDIVFGAGKFNPGSALGLRVLAHELDHASAVPTTGPSPGGARLAISSPDDELERRAERVADRCARSHDTTPGSSSRPARPGGAADLHRQMVPGPSASSADLAAEREYGDGPAPLAQTCGRPSHCPPGFCDPYRSQQLAEYYRATKRGWIMAGISAAVDSRVVPLWQEYLDGGSAPKDLTATFGADFTASRATRRTTDYLVAEIRQRLVATRPAVTTTSSVNLPALIPSAIAAINTSGGPQEMNFNIPRDVAGNLAGGIGTNQTACRSGARPSPFNDERLASGSVELTRVSPTSVEARPLITYRVRDTIDLCPGDCGTPLEQVATVPLSQFEATGISGDVPFTVDFPAPATASSSVSYS